MELAEPPEGVIAGENVSRGSEPDEYDRNIINKTIALLKEKEAYKGKSHDELHEIAREKLGMR